MMLKKWNKLPKEFQCEEVKVYYDILKKKRLSIFLKRLFDIVVSFLMLIILSPIFLILAILIKIDSKGPVFFRQVRVTQFGKKFKIFKFRTMVHNAESIGSQITKNEDARITRIGKVIRKLRLDEICQLIDVFRGTMSFVGTRPEVPKYVEKYTPQMRATLLLPAGVTSIASIYYKDEAKLLDGADDTEKIYVEKILPEKMYYNLKEIEKFSFWHDIKVMFMTVFAVLGKQYKSDYEEVEIQKEETEI